MSLNQEFVCLFDRGGPDGPFGGKYHLVHGWRVRGRVATDQLARALDELVERHEALRTSIVDRPEGLRQLVQPPTGVTLECRDLSGVAASDRERAVEDILVETEAQRLAADQAPHVRATLARFDDEDAVLVLFVHHLAADGWSMRILIRDLVTLYLAHAGLAPPDLPAAPQYREFTQWQREVAQGPDARAAREYWQRRLDGARLTALPLDRPRSAHLPESTSAHRFVFGAETVAPALRLGRSTRSTPFVVLLTCYQLLVQELTGTTDVVVPTFTPGRGHGRFDETVGSFFNFVPLRTDLSSCRTLRDALLATRRTCMEAFSHDLTTLAIFEAAPELMAPAAADDAAAVVFQLFQNPVRIPEVRGGPRFREVTRLVRSHAAASAIPDGALWTLNLEPSGEIFGSVRYKANLLTDSSVENQTAALRGIVDAAPTDLDTPLGAVTRRLPLSG